MDDQQKKAYKTSILNEMDEVNRKTNETQSRIFALEALLDTRWPLGQRKNPSELKSFRIELRTKQYLLSQLDSRYYYLLDQLFEAIS